MNPKESTGVVPQKTVGLLQIATMLCLVAIGFMTLMLWAVTIGNSRGRDGNRDFIEYWAAGQMLIQGHNPYDPVVAMKLERSAGYTSNPAALTPSPPTIFVLIAPLGLANAQVGSICGLVFLLACLLASLYVIWDTAGRPASVICLLGFAFTPVLACAMAGQIGLVLLLGVALFFRLLRSHPFFAGIALMPCSWKPHLFIPLCIVFLLWVVLKRQYQLLAGVVVGIGAAALIAFAIDVNGWREWVTMVHAQKTVDVVQPNLSRLLRGALDPTSSRLQFVPVMIASVWAVWYFMSRRGQWEWTDQGMVLLIVSFQCAPYSWLTDESVLLVPLLIGAYRAREAGRTLLPLVLILLVSETILIRGHWMDTLDYLWTTPAYLAWWLFATWKKRETATSLAPA